MHIVGSASEIPLMQKTLALNVSGACKGEEKSQGKRWAAKSLLIKKKRSASTKSSSVGIHNITAATKGKKVKILESPIEEEAPAIDAQVMDEA